MAAMQPPAPPEEPPVHSCGVRGCPEKFKALPNWSGGTMQNMKDLHMMIDHPRHQATPEARKRYNDSRYGIYG